MVRFRSDCVQWHFSPWANNKNIGFVVTSTKHSFIYRVCHVCTMHDVHDDDVAYTRENPRLGSAQLRSAGPNSTQLRLGG